MKTQIKICGVSDAKIAAQTIDLGAHYIGIICYIGSKRYVTPDIGKEIAEATLSAGGIPVAVFVDVDAKKILALCEYMNVNVVQLAGSISRRSHHQLLDHIQRIYVLHVDHGGIIQPDMDKGIEQLDFERDYILFDGMKCGSGQTFNLERFHNPYPIPFFLAGGLDIKNVADRIDKIHPDVVDVSSGVESAPGIKDIAKIKAFIQVVNGENK